MQYDCSGIMCKYIKQIFNELLNQTNSNNNQDDCKWCTNAAVTLE